MGSPVGSTTLRVVPGELETKRAASRLVLPTSVQPAWPPFRRVGETVANRVRTVPPHSHERGEVLTYVIEGFASYRFASEPAKLLEPGSARLLTCPTQATHSISPARGGPVRWFSLVVDLPDAASGDNRLQPIPSSTAPVYEDETIVRPLVGPESRVTSLSGLECREISFEQPSTTFLRVGHGRRAIVYALTGRGSVDARGLEAGEAALVEGAAGIAIQGSARFRVIAATVPLP